VGPTLQHAAMAVASGLARCVACVCGVSFVQERGLLGGPGDFEGTREEGGTHEENPVYGLTSPAAGAALSAQRYFALYGATSAELAAVPIAFRKHAAFNPQAIMRTPLTLEDHQASRYVVEPLHLFDCCLISDGAAVVLVTTPERARDGARPPVLIGGMQGMRAGRDEFLFGLPGLGIGQPRAFRYTPTEDELLVYRMAGVTQRDVDALYTYDAFSPLVWFVLERFGFCDLGEAATWTQKGRIELGGELPMNTSGGLLSEAHVSGWNSIVEIVRQLRGEWAYARSRARASCSGRRHGATPRSSTDDSLREAAATHHAGQPPILGGDAPSSAPPAALPRMRPLPLSARFCVPGLPVRAFGVDARERTRAHHHVRHLPQGVVPLVRGRHPLQRDPGRARGRAAPHREPRRHGQQGDPHRHGGRGPLRRRDARHHPAALPPRQCHHISALQPAQHTRLGGGACVAFKHGIPSRRLSSDPAG